jgi:hypothetical protein
MSEAAWTDPQGSIFRHSHAGRPAFGEALMFPSLEAANICDLRLDAATVAAGFCTTPWRTPWPRWTRSRRTSGRKWPNRGRVTKISQDLLRIQGVGPGREHPPDDPGHGEDIGWSGQARTGCTTCAPGLPEAEKQALIDQETRDIYAPWQPPGAARVKIELEDLRFKYLSRDLRQIRDGLNAPHLGEAYIERVIGQYRSF